MGLEPIRQRHTPLKRACLPIPALPHIVCSLRRYSLYHIKACLSRLFLQFFRKNFEKRNTARGNRAVLTLCFRRVELLCKLGLLSRSAVLMHKTLCASLIDCLDSCSYSSLGLGSLCRSRCVGFFESGLESGLYGLVSHSLSCDNFNSFFSGFNIRHFVFLQNF